MFIKNIGLHKIKSILIDFIGDEIHTLYIIGIPER